MIEINLLPEVKKEFVRTQRTKKRIVSVIILASIVSLGLVGVLAFYTFAGLPILQSNADKDINSIAKKLQSDKNLSRNLTLQNQLSILPELHAKKGDFSPLFEIAKSLNPASPNNVYISKITIDGITNSIVIEGTTRDYNAIGVFRDTFKSALISYTTKDTEGTSTDKKDVQLFSNVSFTNVGLAKSDSGGQTASFKATANYDPEVFASTTSKRQVRIPKQKTSPSTENVSLFSQSGSSQGGQ